MMYYHFFVFFPLKSIHDTLIEPCFEQQGVTPWVSGMEQSRRDDLQVPREAEAIAIAICPPQWGINRPTQLLHFFAHHFAHTAGS